MHLLVTFGIILFLLILVINILPYCSGIKIYRFYSPKCPYCVQSQCEWDSFKKMRFSQMFVPIDINRDNKCIKNITLMKKFNVTSVPYVVATYKNIIIEYEGDRSVTSYKLWLDEIKVLIDSNNL